MNELLKYETGGEVARPRKLLDIEALFRAAIDRGPEGVAAMERLMAVRRELNAEQAKSDFDAALAKFQAECPVIPKGKTVRNESGATLYNYAPFESILALVRPVMRANGLSMTLDTDTESKDGWVIATCKITHTAGHSEVSRAKFPIGAGTRAMSTTQVFAAALSFASRRVFCNSLGIITAGEDFDGADARPRQHGPGKPTTVDPLIAAQRRLWELLEPVRGEKKNWVEASQWLKSHQIVGPKVSVLSLTIEELSEACDKASVQFTLEAGK